ncbi:hypothetical protein SAMN04487861_12027 [Selenomonas ruminantium]|uniref:Uncharacterized protein n=1 Tax=Selenomonas ruminantium TaxID=971 RepID=A0A1I3G650_SELRU|nr:hypothetical protein [Selenomonas ruminantium]SFI18975.1 hypothetical protein SAMN04487861_12027 [Selenomonas ruminantium]
MKNEKITHIYTANENDKNWTMPTELEIKAAYKRYKKFKESGVIELDMCCFCKTDLIELLSYQKGSIDEIDGYAETLFYVDDSRFLKILEECDALSGEIFNFNDAYNWVIKYYDATMSKNMFEECIQNTIKTDDNNAFFERRVEKWKKNPNSDPLLSQEIRDGKHPDLLPFLYLFVDEYLPVDIESECLTIGPRPKSFSKKYLDYKKAEYELDTIHGKYALLPKKLSDNEYIYMKSHLKKEIKLTENINENNPFEINSPPYSDWIERLLYVAVCSVCQKELHELQNIIKNIDIPRKKLYFRQIQIAKKGIAFREKFMNMLDIGTEYKQVDLRKIYNSYLEEELEHFDNDYAHYIPEKIEYLVNESVDAGLWKKENRKNRVFITRLR